MSKDNLTEKLKTYAAELEERVNARINDIYPDLPPVEVTPSEEEPFKFEIVMDGIGQSPLTDEVAEKIGMWIIEEGEAIKREYDICVKSSYEQEERDDLDLVQEVAKIFTTLVNEFVDEKYPGFPPTTVFPVIEDIGFRGFGVRLTEDDNSVENDLLDEVLSEAGMLLMALVESVMEMSWDEVVGDEDEDDKKDEPVDPEEAFSVITLMSEVYQSIINEVVQESHPGFPHVKIRPVKQGLTSFAFSVEIEDADDWDPEVVEDVMKKIGYWIDKHIEDATEDLPTE